MTTHAKLDLMTKRSVIALGPQQARAVRDSLRKLAAALLDATMLETWLPMAFRAAVAQELPSLLEELSDRKVRLSKIVGRIDFLEDAAEAFRSFCKDSHALRALRSLLSEAAILRAAVRPS